MALAEDDDGARDGPPGVEFLPQRGHLCGAVAGRALGGVVAKVFGLRERREGFGHAPLGNEVGLVDGMLLGLELGLDDGAAVGRSDILYTNNPDPSHHLKPKPSETRLST